MEEFFNDFKDFINTRIENTRIKNEKTDEFNAKYNKYTKLSNEFVNWLAENIKDKEILNSFIDLQNVIEEIMTYYAKSSYKAGVSDGVNLIYSICPEFSHNIIKDKKME